MKLSHLVATASFVLLTTTALQAQAVRENTYTWVGADHSAWRALSNYPEGYVMGGTKFFESNNTTIYVTGFNSLSQEIWTKSHDASQVGFTALDTFWKSSSAIGSAESPTGFFFAATGMREGVKSYYTLQVDKAGNKTRESFGPIGTISTLCGACQTYDGGFIAVGSNNGGAISMVKFNSLGELTSSNTLSINGTAWSVEPAKGGGYLMGSTGARATRIDNSLNLVWSTVVPLPPSSAPDGSAFSYTEFEDILPLRNAGTGIVITGSAFSNSTSAVYTANVTWDGNVSWFKINDFVLTSGAGTPVAWSNSAIELRNPTSGIWNVFYSWRRGPVSLGGDLRGERMDGATGAQIQIGSLGNATPVQEAYVVRQPFTDHIIIAGTTGGYGSAYSFSKDNLLNALIPFARPASAEVSGDATAVTESNVTNARR